MPHFVAPLVPDRYVRFAAWLVTLVACSMAAATGPTTAFDFNGPETTWQVDDEGRVGRVLLHECAKGGARDAGGYEQIVVAAPGGESVRLICATAPVVVIEELEICIWVKSNRPDAQLAARIALPRTARGDSPAARVTVRGERYKRLGHWQQLVLREVPKQLAAQVRMLRSTSQGEIDSREAFVDAVVLIVPGAPEGVEVATDDLVVDGVVRAVRDEVRLTSYPGGGTQDGTGAASQRPDHGNRGARIAAAEPNGADSVKLLGELLLVGERAFLPRVIQYRNEPLQTLAERGFNVVWLDRTPTAEESAQARKLSLWFIGSPPQPETLRRAGLGDAGDRVLAWYLEDAAADNDPNYAKRWADLVRERDVVSGRPVILAPHETLHSADNSEDIVLVTRPRLAFVPGEAYEGWLARQLPSARPGTPLWASFPSQLNLAVGQQISALSGLTSTTPPNVSMSQLQSQVDVACTRGMRGFVFQSDTPLSEADRATRVRANSLELINRRLQRLEPWLASGNVFGRFPSADATWSGIVLNVDSARLLIPVETVLEPSPLGRGQGEGDLAYGDSPSPQPSPRGRGGNSIAEVTFVVPGVPDSCQVYLLTSVALKSLPTQRIAGGTRFTFRPDDETFVLMTEDPHVLQSLRQHIARHAERMVLLLRENAALKSAQILETARRMSQSRIQCTAAAQTATSTAALLQQVDAALASQRVEQAYQAAVTANQALEQAAAELRQAVIAPATPHSNPLALGDNTLVEFVAFERARPTFQFGENLLYGGDFEDLGQLTQMGWRHFQGQSSGAESRAELSVAEPRHGSRCLILHAPSASDARSGWDEASVWIESPPMLVAGGQTVEIAGWAHVESHNGETSGELQVIDSVGGSDAALTIRHTNGWERFHLLRAIPDETELRLTFALAGAGSARVDAVMVRSLRRPPSRRPSAVGPAGTAGANSTPTAAGPLLGSPGGTR